MNPLIVQNARTTHSAQPPARRPLEARPARPRPPIRRAAVSSSEDEAEEARQLGQVTPMLHDQSRNQLEVITTHCCPSPMLHRQVKLERESAGCCADPAQYLTPSVRRVREQELRRLQSRKWCSAGLFQTKVMMNCSTTLLSTHAVLSIPVCPAPLHLPQRARQPARLKPRPR